MTRRARQALIAIYRADIPATLDWPEGPLPLTLAGVRADRASRSTYYPPRTVRLLYGEPGRPGRWHKEAEVRAGTVTVVALEAIRTDDRSGMLLLHMRPDDILPATRALAARRGAASALNGLDVHRLAPELKIQDMAPFTLAFLAPPGRLRPLYSRRRYPRWPAAHQWRWALASRTDENDFPPDPEKVADQEQDCIRLSADWTGMILRDGMAFVGSRPDHGKKDSFFSSAELYARTLYTDAIALGLMQLQGITDLEEELATIADALSDQSMEGLERRLTLFRHRLWWQHLSTHGIPNQILIAFHRQHRLNERFEQILAEISDFNQLARDDQSRNINNSVVLFTIITVPLGTGLALLQLIGHPDPAEFIAVIAACLAVSFLVLLTRPGRLATRALRKRLS